MARKLRMRLVTAMLDLQPGVERVKAGVYAELVAEGTPLSPGYAEVVWTGDGWSLAGVNLAAEG